MVKRPATSSHSQRLPAPHTHDGAKTHLTPSVAPPHGGAAGDDVNGRRSRHESFTLDTRLQGSHPTAKDPRPELGGAGREQPEKQPDRASERERVAQGTEGRKAPGTPNPPPMLLLGRGTACGPDPCPELWLL